MKSHKRKMLAPIIVTCILMIYIVVYFGFLFAALNGILKILFGIIPIVFGGILIKVCIERIKEIKDGEEDDISKY